jgi:pyridoxamine 5'-phosphate oxidase
LRIDILLRENDLHWSCDRDRVKLRPPIPGMLPRHDAAGCAVYADAPSMQPTSRTGRRSTLGERMASRIRPENALRRVPADPLTLFSRWLRDARATCREPDAMTLATATARGAPSARVVLLRGCDARGLVFHTNYASRKGRELAANPRAAVVFHWPELRRQVRIEGAISKLAAGESDAYFRTRPVGSRIGAIASPQSRVISGRAALERRYRVVLDRHRRAEVPRPAFWGGYRLRPRAIEFWLGRAHRLHDRIRYVRTRSGWRTERLAP